MNTRSPVASTAPLPHLAAISARGADTMEFLHAQLSADLRTLEPGQSRWACCCDIKGRVIALLLIRHDVDGATLICADALRGQLVTHLSRYILRSAVELVPDGERAVVGLAAGDGETDDRLEPPFGRGYGLVTAAAGAGICEDWREAELADGIAWLAPATSGQFLPQMLGFEHLGAVSFDKGCYPGQEVVARVHFLGKVKRLPATVRLSDAIDLAPMTEVEVEADGAEGTAIVVDSLNVASTTTARLVTRLPAASRIDAITLGDERFSVADGGAVQGSATR